MVDWALKFHGLSIKPSWLTGHSKSMIYLPLITVHNLSSTGLTGPKVIAEYSQKYNPLKKKLEFPSFIQNQPLRLFLVICLKNQFTLSCRRPEAAASLFFPRDMTSEHTGRHHTVCMQSLGYTRLEDSKRRHI